MGESWEIGTGYESPEISAETNSWTHIIKKGPNELDSPNKNEWWSLFIQDESHMTEDMDDEFDITINLTLRWRLDRPVVDVRKDMKTFFPYKYCHCHYHHSAGENKGSWWEAKGKYCILWCPLTTKQKFSMTRKHHQMEIYTSKTEASAPITVIQGGEDLEIPYGYPLAWWICWVQRLSMNCSCPLVLGIKRQQD